MDVNNVGYFFRCIFLQTLCALFIGFHGKINRLFIIFLFLNRFLQFFLLKRPMIYEKKY